MDTALDFGTRAEESVFKSLVDGAVAESMIARVHRIIEEHTDKIHILALCDACAARTVTYGLAKQASDPEYLIV